MNVLIFGASGMVGQAILREALTASFVKSIRIVTRKPLDLGKEKLHEIVHEDLYHYEPIENQLADIDACFFCIGVSAAGMTETAYSRVTYDLTLQVARALYSLNPKMTFIYVSGAGTDSSEKGLAMWARVKGKTENALRALSPKAYMFRPGVIQPLHNIRSKTYAYQLIYSILRPFLSPLRKLFPTHILSTTIVGQAMLVVSKYGASTHILESRDIYKASLKSLGS